MTKNFLQNFLLSCFAGGIPVQLGKTHKTKAVHFHLERNRNHLSAVSFPASTVKSSIAELFATGDQQLLNPLARKIGSTYAHAHVDGYTTEGDVLSGASEHPSGAKSDSMENASVSAFPVSGMKAVKITSST